MPEPLTSVTLAGGHVILEPLSLDHIDDLVTAANHDRDSYALTWVPDDEPTMRAHVVGLLADHGAGRVLPFTQRRADTGELVGCTRYLDPHWWRGRTEPDEIEIGGTWLAATAQRTGINTEAKLLLLGHAFERLGVWRVAICTDARNQRSRDAIERIGASFEGILRNHRLRADTVQPTARDTAIFSIVDHEWPAVKASLAARLTDRN